MTWFPTPRGGSRRLLRRSRRLLRRYWRHLRRPRHGTKGNNGAPWEYQKESHGKTAMGTPQGKPLRNKRGTMGTPSRKPWENHRGSHWETMGHQGHHGSTIEQGIGNPLGKPPGNHGNAKGNAQGIQWCFSYGLPLPFPMVFPLAAAPALLPFLGFPCRFPCNIRPVSSCYSDASSLALLWLPCGRPMVFPCF